MAWEESGALTVEEPKKMDAHVVAREGGVNHDEGWVGQAHLRWLWPPKPGSAVFPVQGSHAIILESSGILAWLCVHLVVWLFEKQLERRTDEGKSGGD